MVIKIFDEELRWRGKLLIFTWHFKEEFDLLKKPLEFVLVVLELGEHVLVSKTQNKFNVFYRWRDGFICLSYVEQDNIILIHIKPTSKISK